MKKNYFFSLFTFILFMCIGGVLVSCGGDDDSGQAGDSGAQSNNSSSVQILVSPTAELLGTVNSTTTVTVSVSSNSMWTVSGVPEWLSLNKSGVGSSAVLITAIQENFSDVARDAVLTFSTADGSASATCKVSQRGVLAANCRVTVGETTVMWDGFAADLTFDNNCKGYREACFTASQLADMTDRDIYNLLMSQQEYAKKVDYTYSTDIYTSGTELVYCVAAYGAETNTDGSHKYGPITMKRFYLPNKTIESAMYLTLTYTSSSWNLSVARNGSYGQACNDYYYCASEGDDATWDATVCTVNSAVIAHVIKWTIREKGPYYCYKNGPQTMSWTRSSDKFFCAIWGKNKDTNEFSTYITYVYRNLSSNNYVSMLTKSAELTNKAADLREKYPFMKDLLKQTKIIHTTEPIVVE